MTTIKEHTYLLKKGIKALVNYLPHCRTIKEMSEIENELERLRSEVEKYKHKDFIEGEKKLETLEVTVESRLTYFELI